MTEQLLSYPLTIPLLAALAGAIAGYLAFGQRLRRAAAPHWVLWSLILAALAISLIPFAGQPMYDMGLSWSVARFIINASYAVMGFSVTGAWLLLRPSRLCWLPVALVPLSLFNATSWAFAYYVWDTRGFAP